MFKKILKSYDYSLILVVVLLSIFGLVMIYSSSMVTAIQRYGYESDHFYDRQKIFLIVGAVLFLFFSAFPYKIMLSNRFFNSDCDNFFYVAHIYFSLRSFCGKCSKLV